MPDEPSIAQRQHAPKGPIKARHVMDAGYLMEDRQCTAKSKQSGQRCKRIAIPGGHVCHIHGGAIPHVKEAAMDRLRALQHPAVDRLAKLIDQEKFPTVALGASKDVLDRTLGKAAEIVELHQTLEITITERLLRARARNGHGE